MTAAVDFLEPAVRFPLLQMIFPGYAMAVLTATIRFRSFAVRFPNASRRKMTAFPQNCGIAVIFRCDSSRGNHSCGDQLRCNSSHVSHSRGGHRRGLILRAATESFRSSFAFGSLSQESLAGDLPTIRLHIKTGTLSRPCDACRIGLGLPYSIISVTTPEPTVLPPSLIANLSPSSIAIGVIRSISITTLSPGMHISVPSGSFRSPVTSVVLK